MIVRLALCCLAAVLTAGFPAASRAAAPDSPREVRVELKNLEKSLTTTQKEAEALEAKAASLKKDITEKQKKLVGAAEAMQARETELAVLEDRLETLQSQREDAVLEFQRNHDLSSLAMIQVLEAARQSPLTLLAIPESPRQMARRWSLARQMVPYAQQQMQEISGQLQEIENLHTKIEQQRERILAQRERLEQDQEWLAHLMQKRQVDFQKVAGEKEKRLAEAAKLAAKSRDFQELLAKLQEAEAAVRPAPKPNTRTASNGTGGGTGRLSRGAMVWPASGPILLNYGQKTDTGISSKGVTVKTRPAAVVLSPYEGKVVYAGAFRGYGNLVIIDHGSGYHTLLSGMSRLDTEVGQWLLSGEPLGVMGRAEPANTLYIEFRRNGMPINIMPWIAQNRDKESG